MQSYLELLRNIISNGTEKLPERKLEDGRKLSQGTIGLPNQIFSHNMSDGFPLLTTKKVSLRNVAVELEGFIKGITDKKWYKERGCNIWNEWANPKVVKAKADEIKRSVFYFSDPEPALTKSIQLEENDLGPLGYSWNWRNFGKPYKGLQRIQTNLDKNVVVLNSEESLVGNIYSGKYGKYTVTSYDGKDKYHNKRFTVKFHDSGFISVKNNKSQVESGNIFDPYFPTICNIACVGNYTSNLPKAIIEKLKLSWRAMIHRCYDENNTAYKNYGGRGIFVCDRWLIFENYLNDIQNIDGWDNKINNWRSYQLDKDIKGFGFYSQDSCMWVSNEQNANSTSNNYYFDVVSPDGIEYKNNIGLKKFCRKHGLKVKNVEASIKSNSSTHRGWKFLRKDNYSYNNNTKYVDQLKNIVDTLRSNPNDRRMICSAWNPNQIDQMALPPCHYSWGVTVYDNKLNMIVTIRSQDELLGKPYNIASYALLLKLLSKSSGFEANNLTIIALDSHLYLNQIDAAKEQLNREPMKLPTVDIIGDEPFDIFNWTHKDFKLNNYKHHPPLQKVEVVI